MSLPGLGVFVSVGSLEIGGKILVLGKDRGREGRREVRHDNGNESRHNTYITRTHGSARLDTIIHDPIQRNMRERKKERDNNAWTHDGVWRAVRYTPWRCIEE
jgi:hypothetical protein